MKKILLFSTLATVVGALVATTLDFERFETTPAGRRAGANAATRYTKVGNAGDESAEARPKTEQFAQARTAPGRRPARRVQRGVRVAQRAAGVRRRRGPKSPTVPTTPTIRATAIRSPSNSGGGNGLVVRPHRRPRGRRRLHLYRRRQRRRLPVRRRRQHLDAADRRPADALGRRPPRSRPTARCGSPRARRTPASTAYRRHGRVSPRESDDRRVHDRRTASAAPSSKARSSASCASTASATSTPRRRAGCGSTRPTTNAGAWTRVLYPVPDPLVNGVPRPICSRRTTTSATTSRSSRAAAASTCSSNCAWRDGAAYNGFYYSVDGGADVRARQPRRRAQPAGRRPHDVRLRGGRLGALRAGRVDDEVHQLEPDGARRRLRLAERQTRRTVEQDRAAPASSPRRAPRSRTPSFYRPGIQAWYNQFIDVDPADPNHVFVGLEEVYETRGRRRRTGRRSGRTGTSISAAGRVDHARTPARRRRTPISTRSRSTAARVYVGNDGGLYGVRCAAR